MDKYYFVLYSQTRYGSNLTFIRLIAISREVKCPRTIPVCTLTDVMHIIQRVRLSCYVVVSRGRASSPWVFKNRAKSRAGRA
jgi:hypothetical protein